MKKIALFDFCETLIKFQTADRFVDFVRDETNSRSMKRLETIRVFLVNVKFFSILAKLFRNNNYHKRLKLFQLKGLTENRLEVLAKQYYEKIIKPNGVDEILELLKKHSTEGYKIVIVSGGYEKYIQYFANDYSIDTVVATNIKFVDNKCMGVIDGLDCLHKNKIPKLKEKLNLSDYDLENSIAFSDSITDLPLLKLVSNGYVVSHVESQKWVKENKLNEIIWN